MILSALQERSKNKKSGSMKEASSCRQTEVVGMVAAAKLREVFL
jgi:hypothetical protein